MTSNHNEKYKLPNGKMYTLAVGKISGRTAINQYKNLVKTLREEKTI